MDAFDHALELGHRNRAVMDLARHHCRKLEFRANMGHGLAEEASGLPIDMREVFCEIGGRGSTSADLGWVAREYVAEHCRGCPERQPTGQFPNLLTEVDAAEVEAARQAEARRALELKSVAMAGQRRNARAALLAAADEGTVQLCADLDVVDSPQREDREASTEAFRRVDAATLRAPELFGPDLVGQLFALVRDQHVDRLLRPLRYLARAGVTPVTGVVVLALEVLEARASADAAACIAEFSNDLPADAITRGVVDSCILLIAGPVLSPIGHRETPRDADPAGFLAVADANLSLVQDHIAALLTAAAPEPSQLLVPPGSAQHGTGERARLIAQAEAKRHQGAVAARVLFATRYCGWKELGRPLLHSLAQPDHDDFDPITSHEAKAAVAEALVNEFDTVFADLGHEVPDSAKHAERLVGCLTHVERLLDPDDRFLHRVFEPAHAHQLAADLSHAAVSLLDERWGASSLFHIAHLIHELAQHDPDAMSARADALLGLLLLDEPADVQPDSTLVVPYDPLRWLEELERPMMRAAVERELRHAIACCAAVNPLRILDAVLSADAVQIDPKPAADAATVERVRTVRLNCLKLLCDVGTDHGAQTGVLARVLPLLYQRLLGQDILLRAQAIRGWASIASRHVLPSSLADCGPVLLEDHHMIVIAAIIENGSRILHERDLPALVDLASGFADAYAADSRWNAEAATALRVVYAHTDHYSEAAQPTVERWILKTAQRLPRYEAHRIADLPGWSHQAATSTEMARLRLAFVADPQINDQFNDREDRVYVRLSETGEGGRSLDYEQVRQVAASFLPDRPWDAALMVEAMQCLGRWSEAHDLARQLHASMPHTPGYDGYRQLLSDVLNHAALQADTAVDDKTATRHVEDAAINTQHLDHVSWQAAAVARARHALRTRVTCEPAGRPQSVESVAPDNSFRVSADRLTTMAAEIAEAYPNLTPSAHYLRQWAEALAIAAHLLRAHAAARDAEAAQHQASRQAAALRAEDALAALSENELLNVPLAAWLRRVASRDTDTRLDALAGSLADLPVPLCLAHGRSSAREEFSQDGQTATREPEPVVVCMSWIDDRLVSFTQVLHPQQAYTLRLQLRMEKWPEWAEHADVELISVLGPGEIVLPSYSWNRAQAREVGEYVLVEGEGTLMLRFALGAGQPPQAVRIAVRFRSADGQMKDVNLAGYTELRLRPFDATRDALTGFPQLDERLLAVNDRVRQLTDDEPTLQAFGRLLAAVNAVAAELTYDQSFRRGRPVSERKFHDEVDARLKQDPLLEGRVQRATREGLGITDVVHDGVTCELKVERTSAFDKPRARHYLGQPTQYASAVHKQLSILLVLDTTTKNQPVGVQANYLWLAKPELHGTAGDASHPALVAVVVANSNLNVPSNWSRRTIAAEQPDLD